MTARTYNAVLAGPVLGVEPDFLAALPNDNMVGAIVALTAEVWILRDRLAGLEAELAERRVVPAGALERREPTEAERLARQQELSAFTNRVLAELARDRVPNSRIDPDVARHLVPPELPKGAS